MSEARSVNTCPLGSRVCSDRSLSSGSAIHNLLDDVGGQFIAPNTHQPKEKLITIRRGERGWAGRGAAFIAFTVARVLLPWHPSWWKAIASPPTGDHPGNKHRTPPIINHTRPA